MKKSLKYLAIVLCVIGGNATAEAYSDTIIEHVHDDIANNKHNGIAFITNAQLVKPMSKHSNKQGCDTTSGINGECHFKLNLPQNAHLSLKKLLS